MLLKIFPSKIEQKHQKIPPLELQIVQDADRLMRLVQLGLLKNFQFWWIKNNLMYHPEIKAESWHEQRRVQKIKRNHHQPFL